MTIKLNGINILFTPDGTVNAVRVSYQQVDGTGKVLKGNAIMPFPDFELLNGLDANLTAIADALIARIDRHENGLEQIGGTRTPEESLNVIKQMKISELNDKCDQAIYAGFTSVINSHTYGLKIVDQLNFNGQKDELLENPSLIDPVPWKTEDVGYINHTREDWIAIYAEGKAFIKQNLYQCGALKSSLGAIVINETTTLEQANEQIKAIVWPV